LSVMARPSKSRSPYERLWSIDHPGEPVNR
jgi:hypothetical protein